MGVDRRSDTEAEALLEEMIAQQRRKVFRLGRSIYPQATPEDLLNPQDVGALSSDPTFNYEEGVLAGLLGALVALRARVFARRGSGIESPASGGEDERRKKRR